MNLGDITEYLCPLLISIVFTSRHEWKVEAKVLQRSDGELVPITQKRNHSVCDLEDELVIGVHRRLEEPLIGPAPNHQCQLIFFFTYLSRELEEAGRGIVSTR